jgi:guanylate kinase
MQDVDEMIASYQPTQQAIDVIRSIRLTLLVGISGAGKDTIKQKLLTSGDYHDVVSHTTRAPRENHGKLETDGVEYHFVSMDQMVGMLDRHEIIEANRYSNNVYATSVHEFEQARDEARIAISDIDINGVEAYKDIAPDSVSAIFLIPPSYDVWVQRWRLRYGDDYVNHLDDFERRKKTAIAELRHVIDTPYFFFVVNDSLNQAVQDVDTIARTGQQNQERRQYAKSVVENVLRDMESES